MEDPDTKRLRPRNYLESLEKRLAQLERHQPNSTSSNSPKSTPALPETCDSGISSQPALFASEDGLNPPGDLPARVGFLDVRTGQVEPQYLGSSSAFAFAHVVNSSLRRMLPEKLMLGEIPSRRVDNTPPFPCLLPDPDIAHILSAAYFENIHTQYPFLHEPTYRRYEEQLWGPDCDFHDLGACSTPLFFVNMVCITKQHLLMLPNPKLFSQYKRSAQLVPYWCPVMDTWQR